MNPATDREKPKKKILERQSTGQTPEGSNTGSDKGSEQGSDKGSDKGSKDLARHVLCALADDSVADAYSLMKDINCRHLPVVREGKLIGIVSDRDILLRSTYGSGGIQYPALRVADIMSRELISCRLSAGLPAVAESMGKHKIDAMPVTDSENNLLGIVTSSDLLESLKDLPVETGSNLTVEDILKKPKGH